jgi:DcaP outer membrane protein
LDQMMKEIRGEISALENQRQNPAAPPSAVPPTAAMATAVAPKAKGGADGNKGDSESMLSLYGYVMLDAGQNFKQIDPNWFDVMRPTQLSAFKNEFAPNGTTFWGVRQTRFGVKTSNATTLGDLKTVFEFELFGTGVDAGQTTFRLRHAYGELGHFGAGQTWSPFMDFDVFPNSLEYWGPNGMVFLRNLQVRWMPIKGDSHLTIAAERPGASADLGIYANRIELQGIQPKLDMPDFSIQGRFARRWGYVQVASVFRKISWVDLQKTSTRDLSGEVFGWGVNASSNLKLGKKSTGRFQVVYGEGVENYLNDAPVDVGVRNNFSNPKTPIKGVALPALGVVAFLDHNWSEKFSTAAGYSLVNISNSDAQAPSAFHQGDYALTNLLYNPVKNVMVGGEFQFGRRVNFNDGFNTNDYKLQFSFKYSWAKEFAY